MQRTASSRGGQWPLIPLLLAVLVAAGGCGGTTRGTGQNRPEDVATGLQSTDGLQIRAYITADGVRHSYDGRVRRLDDGSYQFTPYGRSQRPFTLASTEVRNLVPEPETAARKTIGRVILGGLVIAGLAIAAFLVFVAPNIFVD